MIAITGELVRRCEQQRLCAATTAAVTLCGRAVDLGVISLDAVCALVDSCATREQLDGKLLALTAAVALATGAWEGEQ